MTAPPTPDRPRMPGYGVSPDTDGLLPFSWAEERLAAARRVVVSSKDRSGRPHAVPVWAVWHLGALAFSVGGQGRTARNLAADPRCSAVAQAGTDAVAVEGRVVRVTDRAVADELGARYEAKYGSGFPDIEESPLWRLVPEVVFGFVDDDSFTSSATRWRCTG